MLIPFALSGIWLTLVDAFSLFFIHLCVLGPQFYLKLSELRQISIQNSLFRETYGDRISLVVRERGIL